MSWHYQAFMEHLQNTKVSMQDNHSFMNYMNSIICLSLQLTSLSILKTKQNEKLQK